MISTESVMRQIQAATGDRAISIAGGEGRLGGERVV